MDKHGEGTEVKYQARLKAELRTTNCASLVSATEETTKEHCLSGSIAMRHSLRL